MMPVNLVPWITFIGLTECNARSPGLNQLRDVAAGIANQSAGMRRTPIEAKIRIEGTDLHAHRAYSPVKTQASGRPSEASTSIANANRGRFERWQSIAAKHNVTTIGSELAIRICGQ